MNKRSALILSAILCLFLSSCASTQEIKKPPALRLADVILSKGVEDHAPIASPKNPTIIFSPRDAEVVAFLALKNVWGVHTLKWDWFDPGGNLYHSTGDYTIKSAEGKYLKEVTVWHKLSIRGEQAGKLLGDWRLIVYLDKEIVSVRKFTLADEEKNNPS